MIEKGVGGVGEAEEPPIDVRKGKKIGRVTTEWKVGVGDEPTHPHHAMIYRIGKSTSWPLNRMIASE